METAKQHTTKEKLKSCPNNKVNYLIQKNTGEVFPLGCKRYDCDYCGPRKKYKLQKRIESVISSFDHVRMFTFNYATGIFYNQEHAFMLTGEIWRRFLNNIRRDKVLSKRKRAFQYIKTTEFTKRGYPHYHVICDEYIPQGTLIKHWRNAIFRCTGRIGDTGSVHIEGKGNAKHGARYITKYITKMSHDFEIDEVAEYYEHNRRKFKLYSRSGGLRLFYDKCSLFAYEFIQILDIDMKTTSVGSGFTCPHKTELPQNTPTFDYNLPPLWQKLYNQPELYLKELKIASDFHNQQFNNYGMTL